jgi:hypothetical protein
MSVLSDALYSAKHTEESLSVREAFLDMLERQGGTQEALREAKCSIANTYVELGRLEEALVIQREAYAGMMKFQKRHTEESRKDTLVLLFNLFNTLIKMRKVAEAVKLLRDEDALQNAESAFGSEDLFFLTLSGGYATAVLDSPDATRDDMKKAMEISERAYRTMRRVSGTNHPRTLEAKSEMQRARLSLAMRGLSI